MENLLEVFFFNFWFLEILYHAIGFFLGLTSAYRLIMVWLDFFFPWFTFFSFVINFIIWNIGERRVDEGGGKGNLGRNYIRLFWASRDPGGIVSRGWVLEYVNIGWETISVDSRQISLFSRFYGNSRVAAADPLVGMRGRGAAHLYFW